MCWALTIIYISRPVARLMVYLCTLQASCIYSYCALLCRLYNATLAVDVVDINKYISQPVAGLKDGLIRVPLGFSGEVLPDVLHVLFKGCLGPSSITGVHMRASCWCAPCCHRLRLVCPSARLQTRSTGIAARLRLYAMPGTRTCLEAECLLTAHAQVSITLR